MTGTPEAPKKRTEKRKIFSRIFSCTFFTFFTFFSPPPSTVLPVLLFVSFGGH